MNTKIKNIAFQASAILILIAAFLHIIIPNIAPYIMVIGVAGFAATTFTTPYPGKSLRGKRLFNIQILAVLLMIASSYLMIEKHNEWIITMLIAGVLTLYCSILLPRTFEKEQEDENKKQ